MRENIPQGKKFCECGCGELVKVRFKDGHQRIGWRKQYERKCSVCGSDKTYIYNGIRRWKRINNKWYCHNCATKYWRRTPRGKQYLKTIHKMSNKFQLYYRGKTHHLGFSPRKGVCDLCHRKIGDKYIAYRGVEKVIKTTQRHHFAEYDDNDMLKNTIEVCLSCHLKEGWKKWKNMRKQIPKDST